MKIRLALALAALLFSERTFAMIMSTQSKDFKGYTVTSHRMGCLTGVPEKQRSQVTEALGRDRTPEIDAEQLFIQSAYQYFQTVNHPAKQFLKYLDPEALHQAPLAGDPNQMALAQTRHQTGWGSMRVELYVKPETPAGISRKIAIDFLIAQLFDASRPVPRFDYGDHYAQQGVSTPTRDDFPRAFGFAMRHPELLAGLSALALTYGERVQPGEKDPALTDYAVTKKIRDGIRWGALDAVRRQKLYDPRLIKAAVDLQDWDAIAWMIEIHTAPQRAQYKELMESFPPERRKDYLTRDWGGVRLDK